MTPHQEPSCGIWLPHGVFDYSSDGASAENDYESQSEDHQDANASNEDDDSDDEPDNTPSATNKYGALTLDDVIGQDEDGGEDSEDEGGDTFNVEN